MNESRVLFVSFSLTLLTVALALTTVSARPMSSTLVSSRSVQSPSTPRLEGGTCKVEQFADVLELVTHQRPNRQSRVWLFESAVNEVCGAIAAGHCFSDLTGTRLCQLYNLECADGFAAPYAPCA